MPSARGSSPSCVSRGSYTVRNAIQLPWSNGQAEGINRLKTIKPPYVRQSRPRTPQSTHVATQPISPRKLRKTPIKCQVTHGNTRARQAVKSTVAVRRFRLSVERTRHPGSGQVEATTVYPCRSFATIYHSKGAKSDFRHFSASESPS